MLGLKLVHVDGKGGDVAVFSKPGVTTGVKISKSLQRSSRCFVCPSTVEAGTAATCMACTICKGDSKVAGVTCGYLDWMGCQASEKAGSEAASACHAPDVEDSAMGTEDQIASTLAGKAASTLVDNICAAKGSEVLAISRFVGKKLSAMVCGI
mmetsp:Transcript_26379/g.57548  ORF Transcript_26379/g.57548 Transcript_26379/m.57548 type:complete len:153 (-) Transcript_26379:616-1074(-)